ncbi:type 4 pilus major pilin [Stenotrophomonas riyadhensis]
MTYGALGSYAGLTTAQAIADRVPPVSMNAGIGLTSRWAQPVILEPATIDGRPNAGLKIVYHAVPTRACLKLAAAASGGMYDLEIDDTSVFNRGNNHRPTQLDIQAATQRCRNPARLAFTYYGGVTGLSAQVLTPVALPPPPPTSAPPPPAPVVAPPPVAVTPPAPSPGCGATPTAPAPGTAPAGQTCSFIWNSVAAPACWSPLALCVPITAQPPIPTAPPAPPAVTPPIVPPPSSHPPAQRHYR